MIFTNFKGNAVYLLNDAPDWSKSPESTFGLVREQQTSLTHRETRRPFSTSLLTKLEYMTTVDRSSLRLILGALRQLNTQPVIVPFWPAITAWANRAAATLNGGLRIGWKADWSQFGIYASTDPEPVGFVPDYFAPALMGFLAPESSPRIRRDTLQLQLSFVESDLAAYALDPSPSGLALTAGPKPAGYETAPNILPFIPDLEGIEELTRTQVKRDQIGLIREQQQTFYPQAAERSATNKFTLSDPVGSATGSPAQMMQFFATVAGPGAAFWSPSSMECLFLAQDALATDTTLNVADTAAVLVDDCVYIFIGNTGFARTITAVDPVHNTVTIDSALGVAAPASQAAIFPLILSRLSKPQLKLTWLKPGMATAQIQWGEVPSEQFVPGDETLGVTIGQANKRVILFQFTRDLGNGTVLNYYFTNFESDIVYSGQTWSHAPFEHGDITQTLNVQDDNVEVTCSVSNFNFPNNPLQADLTKTAEAPLTVTIIWGDYDGVNVTKPQTMFTGDCSAPARDGNIMKMKCHTGPSMFNSRLPGLLRGVQCSHLRGTNADGTNLISVGCTGPDSVMLLSKWKFSALVAGPVSAGYPYSLNLSALTGVGANAIAALAASAVFLNWFAPGRIEWGAGVTIQRRAIVASTVPAGGALSITLHRFFSGVPNIGDSVTLYPGCDGIYTTCQAFNSVTNPTGKFNNYPNFGGQPFTPIANPSTSGLTQLGTQGGKK